MDHNDFHILTLSGGGFRGLYTASVLAKFEEEAGAPIGQKFDLICGTSVGGIIAIAAALEVPMADVVRLFRDKGATIFQGRRLLWREALKYVFAKHSAGNLREALDATYKGKTLGDAKHRLLVPAVNYSKGGPQIFKTDHHERLKRDWKLSATDVALATSAAPVYLPIHKMGGSLYVDGGLYGNSPGLLGVHEAIHFLGVDPKAIRVLSVGTMSSGHTARGGRLRQRGIVLWGAKLLDLMISSQDALVDHMLKQQFGDRYVHIDTKPTEDQSKDLELDLASKASIETLLSRAEDTYQSATGQELDPFLAHSPQTPKFFYRDQASKEPLE